jgi:hypothetical protein
MGGAILSVAIWAAETFLPQIVASWLKSKQPAPAPTGLGSVRASTDAAKAVDPSEEAIAHDPNNLERGRS